MAPKLKALIELFPDINPKFLDMLYDIVLQDASGTNYTFDEIEVPKYLQQDSDEWYRTLITLNSMILGGDLATFTQDKEIEPNYTTITIKTDYGS